MTILSRPQLVLQSIADNWATHGTEQVTKTAAIVNGTLIKADGTVCAAVDLAAGTYDVAYIVDDLSVNEVSVGDEMTVRVLKKPEWCVLRGTELRLSAVVLSAGEIALFEAGSNPIAVQ